MRHPKNYEIVFRWSEDDEVFVAEAPELPGCIAHGDSLESALVNVNEAITLWIDTAKQLGRAVPQTQLRGLARINHP